MNAAEREALLRRFEPVVRYTRGERFLPVDVEDYVRACSLWVQRPDEDPVCLVPEGELSLQRLAEVRGPGPEAVHYLKFIDPLNVAQFAAYKVQQSRARRHGKDGEFRPGRGRLARVGYIPRFLDVIFSLTLLVRGRVSGDTAAAASIAYERMTGGRERHCYYGRVVEQDGWVVLQYWFFYPFNNWRSGFFGLNDHEADWEMVCVYLYRAADGDLRPEWVACASHDLSGDDLRRRWDDPELEKVGDHPVVYAAAGSHAKYFSLGDYLAELELPLLAPAVRALDGARGLWHRVFRQYRERNGDEDNDHHALKIPFVDYARGDGVSIGPGGEREWCAAHLLDPVPGWVSGYRGLWGLYARDPIAGEDAPAGPMYNRDGTVRRSWHDPTGWAGLDKVPPPDRALVRAADRRRRAEERCRRLREEVGRKSAEVAGLGVEIEALRRQPHMRKQLVEHEGRLEAASRELARMRAQLASETVLIEALRASEERIRSGEKGDPRAHIRRAAEPASDGNLRFGRLAEAWAAVSIALTMVGFVLLALFAREYLVFGLVGLLSLLVFIESGFRRRLVELTTSVTVGLATVSALVLLYEFFWEAVVAAVLLAAGYMLWENLRELKT